MEVPRATGAPLRPLPRPWLCSPREGSPGRPPGSPYILWTSSRRGCRPRRSSEGEAAAAPAAAAAALWQRRLRRLQILSLRRRRRCGTQSKQGGSGTGSLRRWCVFFFFCARRFLWKRSGEKGKRKEKRKTIICFFRPRFQIPVRKKKNSKKKIETQARAFVVNAVLFYSYESLIELLGGRDPSDAESVAFSGEGGGGAASAAAAEVAVSSP